MTETPSNAPGAVDLSTHEDDAVKKMWGKVLKFAEPLKGLLQQIKESSPPSASELDSELQNSDDPKVTEYRDEIAKLEKALKTVREDAHKHILTGYHSVDEDELKKLRSEFQSGYDNVRTTMGTLRKYAEIMDLEDVIPALDKAEFPTLRGVGRVGAKDSSNSAVRARIKSVFVKRADGKNKSFGRIGDAANFSGIDTTEIINGWTSAAGVSKWQEVTEEHTFTVQEHTFIVVPEEKTSKAEADSEENE